MAMNHIITELYSIKDDCILTDSQQKALIAAIVICEQADSFLVSAEVVSKDVWYAVHKPDGDAEVAPEGA